VRRTAAALGTSLLLCLVTAMPALADSSLPQPHGGPDVLGTGGTAGPGGTAFTGSNVSAAALALVVLVLVGMVSLAIAHRRRAAD
jgi:hypothetical protein